MQEVEVVRRFDAPPERVWAVYTDHAGWNRWAGFRKSWIEKPGAPQPNGRGCVRAFGSGGVTAYEEVLEFEPPKRMVYRVVRGGLPMKDHRGEVLLRPDGDGTQLTWRCRFESRVPGLGAPMRWFVTRFFRNALEGLAKNVLPDRGPDHSASDS